MSDLISLDNLSEFLGEGNVVRTVTPRKKTARVGEYLVLLTRNGMKPVGGIYTISIRIYNRSRSYEDTARFLSQDKRDAVFENISYLQCEQRVAKNIRNMKPKKSTIKV